MGNKKNHKRLNFICTVVLALLCALGGCAAPAQPPEEPLSQNGGTAADSSGALTVTDDMGNTVTLSGPCTRIISLYSAHTENLAALGALDSVIGVGTSDIYPAGVLTLPVYDYNSDPEKVIAASPDLVLIRPFINKKAPDFVSAVEKAGIPVISLYPESFDDFDGYVETLGKICGKEEQASKSLKAFHDGLEEIAAETEGISAKKGVFFESTETDLNTVTPDSMPGRAIVLAGGVNIASGAEPVSEGSSIAAFGAERILQNADKIDLYVSQRGAMNAGGDAHSISIRPGFHTIRAVKEGNILLINEKIISSPTFRYYKGVREIARMLYPEIVDSIEGFRSDSPVTRAQMAEMLIKALNKPIFVPASSYYKSERKGHTYGMFSDADFTEEAFDYIETAVCSGYMDSYTEGEKEYFKPDRAVTREELAKILYLAGEYPAAATHVNIGDLASCENPDIVQKIADNGVMGLIGGNFEPKREMTRKEVYDILSDLS